MRFRKLKSLHQKQILLTVFATQWTNRNQVISIFEHVLSRLSNRMDIMNFAFGKLFLAKQTTQLLLHGNHLMWTAFLGDITWNYAMIFKLINWLTSIYIYLLNICTPLSCNSSLKSHRSSHQRCSLKRIVLKKFAIFTRKQLCFL